MQHFGSGMWTTDEKSLQHYMILIENMAAMQKQVTQKVLGVNL